MKEVLADIICSRPGVTEEQIISEVRRFLNELKNDGVITVAVSSGGLYPNERT